jgi:hypothetical protein
MGDGKTTDARKTGASKIPGDELILVKIPRKDLKMSDEELDKVSGGVPSSGYGTYDEGTKTCHGGD